MSATLVGGEERRETKREWSDGEGEVAQERLRRGSTDGTIVNMLPTACCTEGQGLRVGHAWLSTEFGAYRRHLTLHE